MALILGGMTDFAGVYVGALVIGVAEAVGTVYVAGTTGMILPYAIFILVLLLLSGLLHWDNFATLVSASSRTLVGVGLLGGSVGCAALLWLLLEGVVRLLGRYARLHYQVLKPADRGG